LSDQRSHLVQSRPAGVVEILDRILDKGLVIAGDIKISLVSVELLTLRIRLIICSIEKAEQIGLDWWRFDPSLTGREEAGAGQPSLEGGAEGQERQGELAAQGAQQPQQSPASIAGRLRDIAEQIERADGGPGTSA